MISSIGISVTSRVKFSTPVSSLMSSTNAGASITLVTSATTLAVMSSSVRGGVSSTFSTSSFSFCLTTSVTSISKSTFSLDAPSVRILSILLTATSSTERITTFLGLTLRDLATDFLKAFSPVSSQTSFVRESATSAFTLIILTGGEGVGAGVGEEVAGGGPSGGVAVGADVAGAGAMASQALIKSVIFCSSLASNSSEQVGAVSKQELRSINFVHIAPN
mmetsp:Transcript_1030/g.1802  ORF Transcript_1030/g.1802 Transcript_1030/m.1802 type:complete len:220 (-) Transcript_1030:45-704(-)